MKAVHSLLAILVTIIVAVQASISHGGTLFARNHNHIARNVNPRSQKRCPNRPKVANLKQAAPVSSSSAIPTPHPTSPPKAKANPPPVSHSSSLIDVSSSKCGPNGATADVTATTGPNGKLDWLNCGINNPSGWSPPHIKVSDIKTKILSSAVKESSSPFKACESFVGLFERYAGEHGYPAILLASFAMQESSCNPNTVGGNGEQGLMQITKDKCGGAPGGNCKDPDFNIKTGAAFFASLLDSNGGDLLTSIGRYNGWYPSMTYGDATAAASGPFCLRQNNLDYLFQFLNGWCQNLNAYDTNFPLGKYFNLNKCH